MLHGPPSEAEAIEDRIAEWMEVVDREAGPEMPEWEIGIWDCAETCLVNIEAEKGGQQQAQPSFEESKRGPVMRGRGAMRGRGGGMTRGGMMERGRGGHVQGDDREADKIRAGGGRDMKNQRAMRGRGAGRGGHVTVRREGYEQDPEGQQHMPPGKQGGPRHGDTRGGYPSQQHQGQGVGYSTPPGRGAAGRGWGELPHPPMMPPQPFPPPVQQPPPRQQATPPSPQQPPATHNDAGRGGHYPSGMLR
eukprot:2150344-Rhodomonas_salina.1